MQKHGESWDNYIICSRCCSCSSPGEEFIKYNNHLLTMSYNMWWHYLHQKVVWCSKHSVASQDLLNSYNISRRAVNIPCALVFSNPAKRRMYLFKSINIRLLISFELARQINDLTSLGCCRGPLTYDPFSSLVA